MGKYGDALVGTSLGIGSNIFQTALNVATSKYNADLEYQYNKKLADDAYQRQVDFWNMQNAYNSPVQQKARLLQAGLNPALMNGGVQGNTAGNLSSVPNASVNTGKGFTPSDPLQGISILSQLGFTLAQSGLVNKQTEYYLQSISNLKLEEVLKKLVGKEDWLYLKDKAKTYGFDIPDSDYYDNFFGVGAQSEGGVSPSMDLHNESVASQNQSEQMADYYEALVSTENKLRDIRYDQMIQNIEESKAMVKQLDASSKKLLADVNMSEQLLKVQEIVSACSVFYGIDISSLPASLQAQVMEAYAQVVRGEIYPETAQRSIRFLLGQYQFKDIHIPTTSSRTTTNTDSKGYNALFGIVGKHKSETRTTSWLETY